MITTFIHNIHPDNIKTAFDETVKTIDVLIKCGAVRDFLFTETDGYENLLRNYIRKNYPKASVGIATEDTDDLKYCRYYDNIIPVYCAKNIPPIQTHLETKLHAISHSYFLITYIDELNAETYLLTKYADDKQKRIFHLATEI